MQKAWVRFLDQEDPLEKEMAARSMGFFLAQREFSLAHLSLGKRESHGQRSLAG